MCGLREYSEGEGLHALESDAMQQDSWIEHVQDTIHQYNIDMVRICVQDTSNISRSRYVPVRKFLETLHDGQRLSFPSAVYSFDTSATLQPNLGGGFEGGYPSWEMAVDLQTFGVLPYAPGAARVIADLVDHGGKPIEVAPRQLLRKVLDEFHSMGLQVRGSFEYEFYAFRETASGLAPAWSGLQCFSETKQSEVEDIILDILRNLTEMGAGPEVANTEYGAGQFEISNSPFWGVEIADMAFYYRSSIKDILRRKGYKATFMSKPVTDMSGSGAHLHHSVYDKDGKNVFADASQPDGLSQLCRWFVGGQLEHGTAVSALANATVNSYKRLQPYSFAPANVTWGYDNRTCMIRIPQARGDHTRIENRVPGADTDPYVALAAVLAAGLDGIKRQINPEQALVHGDAYTSSAQQLPKSLGEAVTVLEQDDWARETFGRDFLSHYLALRQTENQRFMRHVTDWERTEYEEIF